MFVNSGETQAEWSLSNWPSRLHLGKRRFFTIVIEANSCGQIRTRERTDDDGAAVFRVNAIRENVTNENIPKRLWSANFTGTINPLMDSGRDVTSRCFEALTTRVRIDPRCCVAYFIVGY